MIGISLRRLTVDFPLRLQCDISLFFLTLAEDQVVASSDYDSTHEANHSDSSDVAHTEDGTEEGKNSSQNVILHALIPPEVRRAEVITLVLLIKQEGAMFSSLFLTTYNHVCRTNPSWHQSL